MPRSGLSVQLHIWEYVCQNPGVRQADIASHLCMYRSTVLRALAGMERHGMLLYESDEGLLYPFRGEKPEEACT